MMGSFDDIILQRFFRAAIARLDNEDEPDSEEEESHYRVGDCRFYANHTR